MNWRTTRAMTAVSGEERRSPACSRRSADFTKAITSGGKKPPEPAGRADDAGHGADRLREVVGDQLEDGAGAEAERGGHAERQDRERHHLVVERGEQDARRRRSRAKETRRIVSAPTWSASQPPTGRAMTATSAKPAARAAASGLSRPCTPVQQLRQVGEHRDEAAEGEEVVEGRRPGGGLLAEDPQRGEHAAGSWRAARTGASRASSQKTTAITPTSTIATTNGAVRPQRSAMRGAVRPPSTVPPMPMP